MALEGPIGERIRIYRQRRGLSQRELAGLIQRSESWLSQVERGVRSVDKLSVLIDIAKILKVKVETLSGQPFSLAPNGEPDLDGMAAIQSALGAYPGLGVTALDPVEPARHRAHDHRGPPAVPERRLRRRGAHPARR